jgi:hypothetical protein
MSRRDDIADTGVALIARGGIRALTHRAVDAAARLAEGSTSYYARTHRQLVALVVERLAEYTQEDLDAFEISADLSELDVVSLASSFLDLLARREDAQAVRFALLFELRGDLELRAMLTADAPVRGNLIEAASGVLAAIGVKEPMVHAPNFVGLIDALLMYRTSGAAAIDAPQVLGAYLSGIR